MNHALLSVVLAASAAALADDPPLPNPEKPVDYVAWINAQYSKGIKENAAEVYRQAIGAYVADDPAMKLARRWRKRWNDDEKHRLERWLKRNERCLQRFGLASRMRHCYFALEAKSGTLIEVELPELTPFKNISRLLVTRARLRAELGEGEGAAEDIATLLRVGRHLESQPLLLPYVLGIAERAVGYEVLTYLPTFASDELDYNVVLRIVGHADPKLKPPKSQFECERVLFWDTLQRCCVDTDGDGSLDRIRLPEVLDAGQTEIEITGSLTALMVVYDEFYERWQTVIRVDYATGRRLQKELNVELKSRGHPLVRVALYAEWHTMEVYHRFVAWRRAARLILRIHAFKAEHGRWPTDLKETGAPSSIRRDPFSSKDFVYRLVDGQPLLYSFSVDGDDDGGQPARSRAPDADGDWVFWPPGEK